MSHDFTFWQSDEPLEDDEAGEIFASLIRDGRSERARPSDRIASMAGEISALWPVPGQGRQDDWPLAAPPSVTECHIEVCIFPSRLWDVWPRLGQLAEQYELIMYDPQQAHVFLPRRLSRKRTRLRSKKKHRLTHEICRRSSPCAAQPVAAATCRAAPS